MTFTKNPIEFENFEATTYASFANVGSFLHLDGGRPFYCGTVGKLIAAATARPLTGCKVSADCNLKAMVSRANKLAAATGYKVAAVSKMTFGGYESHNFWLSFEKA